MLFWLIPAAYLAGCQRYEPMPLTGPAVERSLAPPFGKLRTAPDEEQLRSRASELRHPMLAPVPVDLRAGLTPDSAAIVAVVANPTLRAQRNRGSLAAAQLLQAGLLPNPTLDFTFDPPTGGNTLGAVNAYSIGPSWEVTALITHDAKVAAARAQSQSVRLDVAWQEWQFAQAARKAVYDLVALRAQAAVAASVDREMSENAAVVRKAVDARMKTLLDLSASEAATQKAHADFLAVRRDMNRQQLALNQALGLPPDMPVKIADGVPMASALSLPPDQDLLMGIDDRRLDLLALRHGYESQEQTLRATILAQFPKIVLGIHQASDNTGVISTGLGVTVDLPIFDRNQGNIAIQKATRQQLFDEYAARLFEARSTVALALDDIRSLTEQIAAAEAAVPALEELVKTYRNAVDKHNADVLSYYTAQNDLAQKRIELLKLKQELMDNRIALEIAAGRYLPDPPATQPATGPSTELRTGPATEAATAPASGPATREVAP
jgi:outer membrane protein TolC